MRSTAPTKAQRKRLRAKARKARKALAKVRETVITDHTSEWGEVREQDQAERQERWDHEAPAIIALREEGYHVHEFTRYHYRINSTVDVFPSTGRWQLVGTEKFFPVGGGNVIVESGTERRGRSLDLAAFIRQYLPKDQRPAKAAPVKHERTYPGGWNKPWRVWNLREGRWENDLTFTNPDDAQDTIQARANRAVKAAKPDDRIKTRRWVNTCLVVINEANVSEQLRLQWLFDKRHPSIAAKMGRTIPDTCPTSFPSTSATTSAEPSASVQGEPSTSSPVT